MQEGGKPEVAMPGRPLIPLLVSTNNFQASGSHCRTVAGDTHLV